MKQWSISRLVSLGVVMLLAAPSFVSGLAMYNMLSVVHTENSYGLTIVPAARLELTSKARCSTREFSLSTS